MPPEPRRSGGRHARARTVRSARSPSPLPLLLIVLIAVTALAISGVLAVRHFLHTKPSAAAHSTIAQPPANVPQTEAPSSSQPPSDPAQNSAVPSDLSASFATLEQSVSANIGLTVGALGGASSVQSFGQWSSGPAWSTSKIPLVIAALREQDQPMPSPAMQAAITESDNQAAEQIWESLGDPATAAEKLEAVLHESGDPTVVQSQRIRPEYTAFGQTLWSLSDQEHYLSQAACDTRNAPVLQMMHHIAADQRWGLGNIDDTAFKGGWGPSTAGKYLVRQLGLVPTPNGTLTVALAAEPTSGSFTEGIAALNTIVKWISSHLQQLPAGTCPAADRP